MVLTRRDDQVTCLGRDFRPQAAQWGMDIVTPDMSDEAATIVAIEIAEAIIACELISNIVFVVRSVQRGGPYVRGQVETSLRDIANLHAPTFIWK